MLKLHHLTGAVVVFSLAAAIGMAGAAETGTKTMPDSSIYPPLTPHQPEFILREDHRWCYMPSDGCDNNDSEQN
jgi:hypothetical protein